MTEQQKQDDGVLTRKEMDKIEDEMCILYACGKALCTPDANDDLCNAFTLQYCRVADLLGI